MANILTTTRILAALAIIFTEVAMPAFWALYAWCGFSDIIDGTIARKLGKQSELGAKLDSTADFIFVAACAAKIIPAMELPTWLVVWVALIALCKIVGYLSGLAMHGKIIMPHTTANKITGLLIFASIPLMLLAQSSLVAIPACAVATFAAVQEGHLVRTAPSESKRQSPIA